MKEGTTQPMSMNMPQKMQEEVEKRRTFAIISHPDAGKTTLTEKAAAVWRRDSLGRYGQRPQGKQARHLGLDGN